MKKKISVLLCLALVISAFMPILATAAAKKPDSVPPPMEKRVIIHYKRGYGKPSWAGGGKPPKDNSGQYKLLGKGVEWKGPPVTYVIDPNNPYNLSESFIVSAITASAEEWDAHTGSELFGGSSIVYDASWDDEVRDGRNELLFGDYPGDGVIAVTIIWGIFSGPPKTREIVEFDILFDTDFVWGDATVDPDVMDLQNIATHELGHGVGLADLYDSSASDETMYGYSTEGETKKRDLFTGDIAGIQELYGE